MSEIEVARYAGKTVRIPFDALVKELGLKRAIQFISEIRENYGDSVLELQEKTKNLALEDISDIIKEKKKTRRG